LLLFVTFIQMSVQKEEQLLDAIFKFGQGATQQDIVSVMGKFDAGLLSIMNSLVEQGRVRILEGKDGVFTYQAISNEQRTKFKGLSDVDMALYQAIEASRDRGIWIRDLCHKTGVSQTSSRKALKALEGRKLVKEVKVSTGKKVYMLTECEPTPFHNRFAKDDGGELRMDLLDTLQEEVLQIIETRAFSTAEEIADLVQQRGHDIKPDEVEVIASVLIYDGLVDKGADPRQGARRNAILYRPMRVKRPRNGFVDMPCGKCPLFNMCTPGTDISPEKCVYYTQWLEEL